MENYHELIGKIQKGSFRALARGLTWIENDSEFSSQLLKSIKPRSNVPVIGLTGPPGAGKSTLVNALISHYLKAGKKIAVLAVDPTSPFNHGALLGDRVRMAGQFNHPDVYIRSIATRGSLGGLSGKTLEMLDLVRTSIFDIILVETVGVGQSEIEISGMADKTVVVLVPESGDEIQHIKSGLMEIAQIFVVNKGDRDGAISFANRLKKLLRQQHQSIPVILTVAHKNVGIEVLANHLDQISPNNEAQRLALLTEKAYQLIQSEKMKRVEKSNIKEELSLLVEKEEFNLYKYVEDKARSN